MTSPATLITEIMVGVQERQTRPTPNAVQARMDISQSSRDTAAHWAGVAYDQRAHQSIDLLDRKSARAKARHEVINSDHAQALVGTMGLMLGSTGPQLRINSDNQEYKRFVQGRYASWAKKRKQGQIARLVFSLLPMDGDALSIWCFNPKRRICPVDLKIIEQARLGNPNGKPSTEYMQDGIFYDIWGNPEQYCIYNTPKYLTQGYDPSDYTMHPADHVSYIFEPRLPEQTRGVSWLASSIENLGRLRDISYAYLELIKSQASVIGAIETELGYGQPGMPDESEALPWVPYLSTPLNRNTVFHLPPTAKFNAVTSSATSIPIGEVITDQKQTAGHAIGLPRNSSTGSSHEYNYSSAKRDDAKLQLLQKVFRDVAEADIFDREFALFYDCIYPEVIERFHGSDILTPDDILDDDKAFTFWWLGLDDIDPVRTADADATNIESGADLIEHIAERKGFDPEEYKAKLRAEREEFAVDPKTDTTNRREGVDYENIGR